jgi:beta-glucosidase
MDVPQLYVRDVVSSIETPVRQLKAFQKIELSSKDSMRIVLAFPLEELALTDENGNSRIEPGEFEIQIGKSSDYILFKEVIQVGDRGRWNWGELSRQVKKVQSCLGKNMKIGGVVRDIQATPVEGVEILSESKGNFLGYTDTNGRYLIYAQQGECLLFRKKGYLQEKAKVTDEEFMPIVLRNDKFDK